MCRTKRYRIRKSRKDVKYGVKYGGIEPAVGETVAQNHKLILEKPSRLSEKKLLRNHQLKLEKTNQLSERKVLQNHQLKVDEPSQLSERKLP